MYEDILDYKKYSFKQLTQTDISKLFNIDLSKAYGKSKISYMVNKGYITEESYDKFLYYKYLYCLIKQYPKEVFNGILMHWQLNYYQVNKIFQLTSNKNPEEKIINLIEGTEEFCESTKSTMQIFLTLNNFLQSKIIDQKIRGIDLSEITYSELHNITSEIPKDLEEKLIKNCSDNLAKCPSEHFILTKISQYNEVECIRYGFIPMIARKYNVDGYLYYKLVTKIHAEKFREEFKNYTREETNLIIPESIKKQKEIRPDNYKFGLYDEMLEKLDSIYELLSEDDIRAIIRLIDIAEKASYFDKMKKIINNKEE